ncbi:unnamed protein product [Lathyrus sativus]|nr:unnamed protein product [Lathyrus sativus]
MFSFNNVGSISIKYFLPGNKTTLISISNDKDLQRMVKFHHNSSTIEIYVFIEEVLALEVSIMPASRSSRTTLSETVLPINTIMNPDAEYAPPVASHDTIQIDTDMEIPLLSLSPNEEKLAKGAQQWQNTITGVGQRFNSVHDF